MPGRTSTHRDAVRDLVDADHAQRCGSLGQMALLYLTGWGARPVVPDDVDCHLTWSDPEGGVQGDPEADVAERLLRVRLPVSPQPVRRGHGTRRAPFQELLDGHHLEADAPLRACPLAGCRGGACRGHEHSHL